MYKSIDLFAGPGGLCTGFKWAGIRPLIAIEWSYWTVQTYSASHDADVFELENYLNGSMQEVDNYFKPNENTLLIYGDINKVDNELILKILRSRFGVDTVDIVTGGAPCESFSMAGDRKEQDDRNILYKNVLRIARAVDSKMFMFENVKGLFSKRNNGHSGKMYEMICEEFQQKIPGLPSYSLASTEIKDVLLKAADYGVPQMRERIFLVGINDEYENCKFEYPPKTHGINCDLPYISVADALMDLPTVNTKEENNVYDFNFSQLSNGNRVQFLRRMRGDLSMVPNHIVFNDHSLSSHKGPGHTKK